MVLKLTFSRNVISHPSLTSSSLAEAALKGWRIPKALGPLLKIGRVVNVVKNEMRECSFPNP